jgi:uncharacterized protein involved in response to NO
VPPVHANGRPPRPERREAAAERWRAARLLEAPHRLGFFVGAVMLAASALWWLAVLLSRAIPGGAVSWALAPGHAHALLMGFSFMPMFFAGFLFTAGPRWLALPPVAAGALLPTAAAWPIGWGLFLVGAHADPTLAAAGLAVVATGWSLFAWRFACMLGASAVADRTHLRIIAGACVAGAIAMWSAASGTALDEPIAVRTALAAGLWWFLAPVFATAMHRMVPFLGVAWPRLDDRHPNWLLWTLVAVLALQVPFASGLGTARPIVAATLVLDAAASLLVLGLALRWVSIQNLRIRMLAMLHAGFVWLGVALALQAFTAAQALSGAQAHESRLAAAHALGMGFFGSLQLTFVTRVSAGQDGRAQAADDLAWTLFWLLQAAVALRLAAAWRSDLPGLLIAAVALWATVMVAWSMRYARWYGRPRSDGRPG